VFKLSLILTFIDIIKEVSQLNVNVQISSLMR